MIENILLGTALAMDAAAVSTTNGIKVPKMEIKKILFIALMFGLFQGVMPLLGYICGSAFTKILASITPWIALILLSFIGGKMIYETFKENDEITPTIKFKEIIVQSIATSIDALAVGLVFVGKKINVVLIAVITIAIVTFIISVLATFLGKKFGDLFSKKASFIGGIILIGIGLRIFIEYLITIF